MVENWCHFHKPDAVAAAGVGVDGVPEHNIENESQEEHNLKNPVEHTYYEVTLCK